MERGAPHTEYSIHSCPSTDSIRHRVRGPGLHTGVVNEISLQKVPTLEWLEFSAVIDGIRYSAPALWTRLSGTTRSTALVMRGSSKRRFELHTVEHFLAAAFVYDLQGYQVIIDLEAKQEPLLEMPILDGSSKEWMFLKAYQSEGLPRERKVWIAVKEFEVGDSNRNVRISPAEGCSTQYRCYVDFGGPWRQESSFDLDWMNPSLGRTFFEEHIASARTFGFKHELEELVKRGLIRGANLDNALLLDGSTVWNQGGFRVKDELAAHKLLDVVGDFALLGRPVIGTICAHCAGHQLHLLAAAQAVKSGALVEGLLRSDGTLVRVADL